MTFLDMLREEFETELKTKTGWGRNEILIAFDKASVRAVVRYAKYRGIELM